MIHVSVWQLLRVTCLGGFLAGCAATDDMAQQFSYRWGPNPRIPHEEFNNALSNQLLVLNYITTDAKEDLLQWQPGSEDYWFRVAQWGFNVGRQDCSIYMTILFRLNREKGRNAGILAGLNTAAAGIITATTTSQKPLSLLAAVFGLSAALNESILQTYLFSEAPGLVAIKVKDLQDDYRKTIEDNQVKGSSNGLIRRIDSGASAYNAIQNYYSICLPQSIEGVLLEKIANSSVGTPNPGTDKPKSSGNPPKAATATSPNARPKLQ